jgi:hypothetical protein
MANSLFEKMFNPSKALRFLQIICYSRIATVRKMHVVALGDYEKRQEFVRDLCHVKAVEVLLLGVRVKGNHLVTYSRTYK